mmetsp:Transcript_43332/g.44024  ORF Transcript_43332/g.44024 Transcript_43332/m.44024 type:complete len:114 (-) Transcript_43332:1345-1686(-)
MSLSSRKKQDDDPFGADDDRFWRRCFLQSKQKEWSNRRVRDIDTNENDISEASTTGASGGNQTQPETENDIVIRTKNHRRMLILLPLMVGVDATTREGLFGKGDGIFESFGVK